MKSGSLISGVHFQKVSFSMEDWKTMGRLVEIYPRVRRRNIPVAVSKGEAMAPPPSDDVATRIAKFIPSEIIAGYIPLVAGAEAITDREALQFQLALIAFVLGGLLTPIYLILYGKPKTVVQVLNVVFSTIAFVLWAYLLGGPFAMKRMEAYLWPYDKRLAAFVVGAFTWIVGLIPYQRLMTPKESE